MSQHGRGNSFVNLTHEHLDLADAVRFVTSHEAGAVVTFSGTTRSTFEDKVVARLEYEAYEPMAVKNLNDIVDELRCRWEVDGVWLQHRLGEVPVGETSVLICVSSKHRKEALHAVEFAIDTLKESVPIWKKERYADGTAEWKANERADKQQI